MVFEQSYTIKVRSTGQSTMRMELFEDALCSVVEVYNNGKSNMKIVLTDSKGEPVRKRVYSFTPYINGVPAPRDYLIVRNLGGANKVLTEVGKNGN